MARYWRRTREVSPLWQFVNGRMLTRIDNEWRETGEFPSPKALLDFTGNSVRECDEHGNDLTTPTTAPVEKPSYYIKGGMECIDVINAVVVDCGPQEAYLIGNVIKYLWRFKQKNGKEDVAKARKYIDMLLASMA